MKDDVKYLIDPDIWHRTYTALNAARDNAQELYQDHMDGLGTTTKKNKCIAEMYEKEISELGSLIEYAYLNNGAPF